MGPCQTRQWHRRLRNDQCSCLECLEFWDSYQYIFSTQLCWLWRFEREASVSTRWNNLPMIECSLVFELQVTIPGGLLLDCQSMGGRDFWSYFVQVTVFRSIKIRSRIFKFFEVRMISSAVTGTSISSKVWMALFKGLQSPLYFWMKNFS